MNDTALTVKVRPMKMSEKILIHKKNKYYYSLGDTFHSTDGTKYIWNGVTWHKALSIWYK